VGPFEGGNIKKIFYQLVKGRRALMSQVKDLELKHLILRFNFPSSPSGLALPAGN
jgi:hypothetical protein